MKQLEASMPTVVAERFAALSRVGTALLSEVDESRLLHLIAETACDLTGAAFAAFSLRPVNEEGEPLVPSEGSLFHLAAIVGVTREQEALLRRMSLGGEGLLAPIFRYGIPVRVADAFAYLGHLEGEPTSADRNAAREVAFAYAQGHLPKEELRSLGVPRGHPFVRSFLGVPVLDHVGQVRGGLLLGHPEPEQFAHDDELLLVSLASQAAVALENAQLYRLAQRRAQQLHAIVESIADGVLLVGPHGTIVRENEAARRVRQRLKDSPEGEQIIEALLDAPAQRALAGQVVKNAPVSGADGSGEARTYLVQASPLRQVTVLSGPLSLVEESRSQDGIAGAVVVWHDVTAERLREAERELVARARQFEVVFEAMTDAIFVYDRHGSIVQMNAAASELVTRSLPPGYAAQPPEERFSQLIVSDEHGQPFPRASGPISRILQGEVFTADNAVEVALLLHDGSRLHLSLTGGPLRDADCQISGAVVITQDITQRRGLEQAERRLHAETEAQRALLQLILDELPSSVYLVHGHDAQLVLANRAAHTIWGATWPQHQPMREFLSENGIRLFGMDGYAPAPEQWATLRALRNGEMVFQYQEIIRHADGTTLPVVVNAIPLDASHLVALSAGGTKQPTEGTEPTALVMHQDVTALKEGEQLKDEFIAIAAHELRNPLAVLKGYAQTLLFQHRQGRGSELEEWQKEALQNIDKATVRLVELTEELLDVTRLQAGRLELRPEPTDLVALCQRLVKRQQMTTEHHPLSLQTSLDYLVVLSDPGRMEQVLSNLISNAIKYSPQEGPIKIALWEEREMGEAILSVRDAGIGIPAQEQARIFGRFARASNTHKITGTGLGLYLCHALVEQHGGRIWFESVENLGSTFFVALPIYREMIPS